MKITKELKAGILTVIPEGRLDTTTAPALQEALSYDGVSALEFDFKALDYISSAGLRVILSAQKAMNKLGGELTVKNVNETIMEVLDITGFSEILTII